MINIVKTKAFNFAQKAHLKIFGHEMSETMREFLGHLSWSFFGGVTAGFLMFVINILAGRWLGPEGYGKFSLALSISFFTSLPIILGLDSSLVKYISHNKNHVDIEKYVGSASSIFFILIMINTLSLYFYPFVAKITGLEINLLYIGFAIGLIYAIRNFFDSIVRGLHLFKAQAKRRVLESVVILFVFILLKKFNGNYALYALSIAFGYIIFSLFCIKIYIKNIGNFKIEYAKKIFSYAVFAVVGGIAGIIISYGDNILIGRYVGVKALGLYNAYYTVSIMVASQLAIMFTNVFFPMVSGSLDGEKIFNKINRIARLFFLPAVLLMGVFIFFAMKLFGSLYALNAVLISEFSVFSVLFSYFTVIWWLIASTGIKGIKFTSTNGIIAASIFLTLSVYFKQSASIELIILFLIISVLYNIIMANMFYGKITQRA